MEIVGEIFGHADEGDQVEAAEERTWVGRIRELWSDFGEVLLNLRLAQGDMRVSEQADEVILRWSQ